MVTDPETARSDVALAAVALVLGAALAAAVRGRVAGALGVVAWSLAVVATTVVPAVLLARSRGDGAAAMALERRGGPPARTAVEGLALAVPVALAGPLAWVAVGAPVGSVVAGRLALDGGPVGGGTVALRLIGIVALAAGALVAVPFLATRTRDAARRSPERPLQGLLRTGGIGAAAIALVAGLVGTLLGGSATVALVNAVALALVVLAADRLVGHGTRVPRIAVIAPVVVVVLAQPGGLTDLVRSGVPAIAPTALAAGTTAVLACVALSRRGAWPLAPFVVAAHLWPTCLSPLPMATGVC